MNRTAVNVFLAAFDLEVADLAQMMGRAPGSVSNVLGGHTPISVEFREEFCCAIEKAIFGGREEPGHSLPTAPMVDCIQRRARMRGIGTRTMCKDLGLSYDSLRKRNVIGQRTADRYCGALGVHPSEIWEQQELEPGA